MQKYRVRITDRQISHIEVEAENATDAERKADNIYEHNVQLVQLAVEMSGVTCVALGSVGLKKPRDEIRNDPGLFDAPKQKVRP